eukprot:s1589_g1.t3
MVALPHSHFLLPSSAAFYTHIPFGLQPVLHGWRMVQRRPSRGAALGLVAAVAAAWAAATLSFVLGTSSPRRLRDVGAKAGMMDVDVTASMGMPNPAVQDAKERLMDLLEDSSLEEEVLRPEGKPMRGRVDEAIVRLERLNTQEEPVYSIELDGTWNVKYAGSYAPGLLSSPTRELALFLYGGGFSLGNALSSFAQGFWGQSLGVKLGSKKVQISGGRDVEASAKVEVAGRKETLTYKAELMPLSAQRMSEEVIALKLPDPIGDQDLPLELRRSILVTYLDEDMMIVRDESGVPEVLVKELAPVSPTIVAEEQAPVDTTNSSAASDEDRALLDAAESEEAYSMVCLLRNRPLESSRWHDARKLRASHASTMVSPAAHLRCRCQRDTIAPPCRSRVHDTRFQRAARSSYSTMGVPMLRPTPGSPGLPSILALNPAWLDIFRFCSIRDLGASLAVDRNWRAAGDSHHVWADAYDRTQRVDDSSAPSGENLLRSLIERPFGEDAVGWHVAVLAEDHGYSNERYYTGRVVAYSAETDTYLIAYDSDSEGQEDQPHMHWEQERRKRTAAMRHNPSLAGKSRFSPRSDQISAGTDDPGQTDGAVTPTTSTDVEPKFARVAGDQPCPHLMDVASADLCQKAAEFFGKRFVGALEALQEPSGCLHRVADDDYMFNVISTSVHKEDRRRVCTGGPDLGSLDHVSPTTPSQVEEEVVLPPPDNSDNDPLPADEDFKITSTSCPAGTFPFRDPQHCKKAARRLKRKFAGFISSLSEPYGCIHRAADQDIMFNRFRTKFSKDGREVVCSSKKEPDNKLREPLSQASAQQLKLYCFGWTARRPREELLLPLARQLFQACDGYAFFTDTDAPGENASDIIKIPLPRTQQLRSEQFWLLLKNMVGLLPAWDYLLRTNTTDGFDWVVNLELDHFVVASQLRRTIADYVNIMILGSLPGQDPWDDAIMLIFGNVFAFNAKLAQQMKAEWGVIGRVISDSRSRGLGCPVISGSRAHNEGHCEQDMVYENLRDYLSRPPTILGANGCGNDAMSDILVPFPLGCWQAFPLGEEEPERMKAIREVALLWNFTDVRSAEAHCKSRGEDLAKHCTSLFRAKRVPIIHNMKTPALLQLAIDVLLPLSLGAVSSSSTASAGPLQKAARSRDERPREPLRGSWKEELKHNVLQAPTHMLTQLKEHSDEVLFVVFSPCGTRLASCSRDLQTIVFKVQTECDSCSEQEDFCLDPSTSESSRYPRFEREAVFTHQTAPCRAMWWPIPPYDMVAVSTEDAGAGWQASKVEIWQIQEDGGSMEHSESEGPFNSFEELPVGYHARCIFQCHNRPFDIYAAIFPWPPLAVEPTIDSSPKDEYERLCFLAGWAVLRENEHYVQWLNVWPGPRHPSFQDTQAQTTGASGSTPRPLARLRLEGQMNYLHCLEVGPPDKVGRQQILAMTGSTPHLCNEIGLMDLSRLQRRGEGVEGLAPDGEAASALPAVYDVKVKVYSMGERVVLSAKWNEAGDFILLNTRPYAHAVSGSQKTGGQSEASQASLQAGASFEDLLLRPAPDLSTKMELLLLDARTLDVLSVFDGHFAFTTKESPFLIFTEEWSDSDFLASGGEDHRVYIWHRRHGRLIRRLCGKCLRVPTDAVLDWLYLAHRGYCFPSLARIESWLALRQNVVHLGHPGRHCMLSVVSEGKES